MSRFSTTFLSAVLALPCALATSDAPAQSAAPAGERAAPAAKPDDPPDFVYTNEYLQERFKRSVELVVYTNENLDEAQAAPETAITNEDLGPAEAPAALEAAITNEELQRRFGDAAPADVPAAAGGVPVTPAADAGVAPGTAAPPPSAADRTRRAAEVHAELERLQRRLLAIRNPLLAGTVPPTDAEREAEAGLDNRERLARTEARITELKSELEELEGPGR